MKVFELVDGKRSPAICCDKMIGALNGLYAKGYTLQADQIDHEFSLKKKSPQSGYPRYSIV